MSPSGIPETDDIPNITRDVSPDSHETNEPQTTWGNLSQVLSGVRNVGSGLLRSGLEIVQEVLGPPVREMSSVYQDTPPFRSRLFQRIHESDPTNYYVRSTRIPNNTHPFGHGFPFVESLGPTPRDPTIFGASGQASLGLTPLDGLMQRFLADTEAALLQVTQQNSLQNEGPRTALDPEILETLPLLDKPPTEDWTCSICLEGEDSTTYVELPCKHVFHLECVGRWFQEHRDCPVCRQMVTAARVDADEETTRSKNTGIDLGDTGNTGETNESASVVEVASTSPNPLGAPSSVAEISVRLRMRDGVTRSATYPETTKIHEMIDELGEDPEGVAVLFLQQRVELSLSLREAGVQDGDMLVLWRT